MVAKRKEVAVVEDETNVPAFLVERLKTDAGKGLSKDQADNVVPLIYVLQALSPQVQKRNAAYITGAEPGSIWLRNSSEPIVSGEEGIIFQPCFFSKDFVEWIPRDSGGGFVAKWKHLPDTAQSIEDTKGRGRPKFVQPNGNELRETRYHYGYVYHNGQPMPFVIPMSGSGHQVSKAWMTLMNSKGDYPSFAHICLLKTRLNSNAQGEWFGWDISVQRFATEAEYELGSKLFSSLAAGLKTAEEPLMRDDADGVADGVI